MSTDVEFKFQTVQLTVVNKVDVLFEVRVVGVYNFANCFEFEYSVINNPL